MLYNIFLDVYQKNGSCHGHHIGHTDNKTCIYGRKKTKRQQIQEKGTFVPPKERKSLSIQTSP